MGYSHFPLSPALSFTFDVESDTQHDMVTRSTSLGKTTTHITTLQALWNLLPSFPRLRSAIQSKPRTAARLREAGTDTAQVQVPSHLAYRKPRSAMHILTTIDRRSAAVLSRPHSLAPLTRGTTVPTRVLMSPPYLTLVGDHGHPPDSPWQTQMEEALFRMRAGQESRESSPHHVCGRPTSSSTRTRGR